MYKKLLSVLALLSISNSSIAQESEDSVEEVVTVGTKASLISAIDKQRNSNLIVSVVDSDALGDFPIQLQLKPLEDYQVLQLKTIRVKADM